MNTGLITFHYAHHYGAQLQAYALMKTIQGLGMDCEIINYVRPDTKDGNKLFKTGLIPKSLLSNAHTLLYYSAFKKRQDRFFSFVREQMKLSSRSYTFSEELMEHPPVYDAYVCGSDQIWNPFIFHTGTFDPSFFIRFVDNKLKIAYAPSFGISSIPEDKKEVLKSYLSDFDFLSVREKQGENIINDLLQKPVTTVLDPTLLLDADMWSKIAVKPEFERPYILCYFVSDPSPFLNVLKHVADAANLPVITLCGSRMKIPCSISTIMDAGPCEFLGLFKHAALVCSNSFHGTIFSINFKKDFFSFTSSNHAGKTVNSRLNSILEILELTDRMITPDKDGMEIKSTIYEKKIDYAHVDELLQAERKKSVQYLSDALNYKS